ncbi:DNA-processing protein DprA [Microbacter margulisiae]|uniref:DNA processing protein n=1 Tax=Microbacter margulisiae TaxID=1350067 RepID=A0A7W5H1Y7_9PORP|nr:DNA-processing protein DprA [Microbacter margulisiae]MBB3186876.1 DNA processing protein [Microbacter margulisiae]
MNESSLRYYIGLTLIKGIGPILAKNLIAFLGSAEAVFKEKASTLEKIPGIGTILATIIADQASTALALADKELEYIHAHHIRPLIFSEQDYPFRLKECDDSPIVLYYDGTINLNDGHFIAFVGTRMPTDYGKSWCTSMIEELAQKLSNIIIVSGLAYGIDITAHKVALKNEIPTIGVVAHGLDRIYPATHTPIGNKMAKNGGIVSEYSTGTNPDRPNFVQRNRIIAGLSDAIIIVESAARGGALLTAEAANSYNRDVFALPGRIGDIRSEGCNNLIKENKAMLIGSSTDLLNAMNWESKDNVSTQQTLFSDLNQDEQTILTLLRKSEGLQINQLTVQTQWPVEKLFSMLLEMEFKGIIRVLPGNVYKAVT